MKFPAARTRPVAKDIMIVGLSLPCFFLLQHVAQPFALPNVLLKEQQQIVGEALENGGAFH